MFHDAIVDAYSGIVTEARRNILDKADGLVAKVFLAHKDEIDQKATDSSSAEAFKQFVIELVEKEAKDMPSKAKILAKLAQMNNKTAILQYLYNLVLAAKGLGAR